jgi:hypothetical protein
MDISDVRPLCKEGTGVRMWRDFEIRYTVGSFCARLIFQSTCHQQIFNMPGRGFFRLHHLQLSDTDFGARIPFLGSEGFY